MPRALPARFATYLVHDAQGAHPTLQPLDLTPVGDRHGTEHEDCTTHENYEHCHVADPLALPLGSSDRSHGGTTMTRVIEIAAFAAFALATACGGDDNDGGAQPGSPEVYERIEGLTDCSELQAEFDRAAENHDRDSARDRTDLMEIGLSYMEAAQDRMTELGCFE